MCDIDSGWKTDSREYHASLPPLPVSLASTTKRLAFHSSLDFSLAVASPAFLACHSAPAAGNDIAINIRACACYVRTKIRPAEIFYYRNSRNFKPPKIYTITVCTISTRMHLFKDFKIPSKPYEGEKNLCE